MKPLGSEFCRLLGGAIVEHGFNHVIKKKVTPEASLDAIQHSAYRPQSLNCRGEANGGLRDGTTRFTTMISRLTGSVNYGVRGARSPRREST